MASMVLLLAALFLSLLLISSSSNVLADYDQHNKPKGQIKKELINGLAAEKVDPRQQENGSGKFAWHRKRLEAKLPNGIRATSPGHSPGIGHSEDRN
ncbi:Ribosomal RNA large subunit methyltransferase [Actinidia chinensis var. chinensis]|uniref:Ribosomal RNA large subunit methyltransferase n=1 Tax=Actinidia chinensis var. chinensis TaxID=1590841 RepID=A0A2R6PAF4_ACTCC|nr:Ribosomal RNA large subunit methyltransferase [Actinidia chinensis var. chinensis]